MKPFANKFYHSKQWLKCRDSFYESKFGLCEKCSGPGLIVHHRELLTPENINNPEVTLNWEKLELLCLECHNKEHGSGDAVAEGLMFDSNGDLVEV